MKKPTFARIHAADNRAAVSEVKRRIRAWEKAKDGPRPTVADVIADWHNTYLRFHLGEKK